MSAGGTCTRLTLAPYQLEPVSPPPPEGSLAAAVAERRRAARARAAGWASGPGGRVRVPLGHLPDGPEGDAVVRAVAAEVELESGGIVQAVEHDGAELHLEVAPPALPDLLRALASTAGHLDRLRRPVATGVPGGAWPGGWAEEWAGELRAAGATLIRTEWVSAALAVRCGPRTWIGPAASSGPGHGAVVWGGPLEVGLRRSSGALVAGGVVVAGCDHAHGLVAELLGGARLDAAALSRDCERAAVDALSTVGLLVPV